MISLCLCASVVKMILRTVPKCGSEFSDFVQQLLEFGRYCRNIAALAVGC